MSRSVTFEKLAERINLPREIKELADQLPNMKAAVQALWLLNGMKDPEVAHEIADAILVECLKHTDYWPVVEPYLAVRKYYA